MTDSGGGARGPDREREHALLLMAVVGDDAPANAVVALREPERNGSSRIFPRVKASPARTERPPFRTASFPGPTRTRSSKTTSIRLGGVRNTEPSAGTVCTKFACAAADAGMTTATRARRHATRLTAKIMPAHLSAGSSDTRILPKQRHEGRL